jgi:hypothetical protein
MAMFRSFLAVIAGFVVASVVMMCVEMANARVLHPGFAKLAEESDAAARREVEAATPEGSVPDQAELMTRRREAVRKILAEAPAGALLVVVFGWMLGSFAGGFVTTRIARRRGVVPALVLGGLLTLAGIANNLMLPPPAWFWILSLIVFLPMAYLGARIAAPATAST